MSYLLNSGLVGHGGDNDKILKTWEQTGLLEGISTEILKLKIALALEDAAQKLLKVNTYANTPYETIIFPVIRRVISDIYSGKHSSSRVSINNEALAELITAEFIMTELHRIYIPVVTTFELIYDKGQVDVEAESAAFLADKIGELYVCKHKNKNIHKRFDMNGEYVVVDKPLPDNGE